MITAWARTLCSLFSRNSFEIASLSPASTWKHSWTVCWCCNVHFNLQTKNIRKVETFFIDFSASKLESRNLSECFWWNSTFELSFLVFRKYKRDSSRNFLLTWTSILVTTNICLTQVYKHWDFRLTWWPPFALSFSRQFPCNCQVCCLRTLRCGTLLS